MAAPPYVATLAQNDFKILDAGLIDTSDVGDRFFFELFQLPADDDAQRAEVVVVWQLRLDMNRHAGAAIRFEVHAVFRRDARQRGGEGAWPAFAIAPRADDGIGVAHGAAFRPRDVLPEVRRVADEVRRARAGRHHVHAREGVDDAQLIACEIFADAQRLPVLDVHARRIERGQHARLAAAIRHFRQPVQSRFAEIIVTHARDLHGGDGHHPLCAIDRAQRDENLHRFLRGASMFAVKHLLFFRS